MESWVCTPSSWTNPPTQGKLENNYGPQDSCLDLTSFASPILGQGSQQTQESTHSCLKTPQTFVFGDGINIRQYRNCSSYENRKKRARSPHKHAVRDFTVSSLDWSLSFCKCILTESMPTVPFQFGWEEKNVFSCIYQ